MQPALLQQAEALLLMQFWPGLLVQPAHEAAYAMKLKTVSVDAANLVGLSHTVAAAQHTDAP